VIGRFGIRCTSSPAALLEWSSGGVDETAEEWHRCPEVWGVAEDLLVDGRWEQCTWPRLAVALTRELLDRMCLEENTLPGTFSVAALKTTDRADHCLPKATFGLR
jgi:hypothetical protein